MGHHPHDMLSGWVGEPYIGKDGRCYRGYQSMEDVSSDSACFPDFQLVTTPKLWVNYIAPASLENSTGTVE